MGDKKRYILRRWEISLIEEIWNTELTEKAAIYYQFASNIIKSEFYSKHRRNRYNYLWLRIQMWRTSFKFVYNGFLYVTRMWGDQGCQIKIEKRPNKNGMIFMQKEYRFYLVIIYVRYQINIIWISYWKAYYSLKLCKYLQDVSITSHNVGHKFRKRHFCVKLLKYLLYSALWINYQIPDKQITLVYLENEKWGLMALKILYSVVNAFLHFDWLHRAQI